MTAGRPKVMATLRNEVEIEAPPEYVFDYLSDLANELEWNRDGVTSIERTTPGTVGIGTHFTAVWPGSGQIDVEYVGFDRPSSWVTLGHGKGMDVNLSALVAPVVGGSRLTVVMELAPRGFLRLMIPVLKRVMQKTEQSNVAKIKATIERKWLAGR
jgi:carbon monoxide dehydrogenase subunit G